MGDAASLRVVQDTYDFILWTLPHLAKFPREQRFLLGDRIQGTLLDVLECLIEAAYSSRKREPLMRANLLLERLRFLVRLTHDLENLPTRSYAFAARQMDGIGAQSAAG